MRDNIDSLELNVCEDISSPEIEDRPTFFQRAKNGLRSFAASTTAGWIMYTPIMAPIEHFYAEMEWDEVGISRLMSSVGHLLGLPLYQKCREIIGNGLNLKENGSKWVKRAVNAASFIPSHPPTYAIMLAVAGTSWDETMAAIPAGLGAVMLTSPVFAPWMEYWRTKVWGMKPTYGGKEMESGQLAAKYTNNK
jgi:hypothetical protein